LLPGLKVDLAAPLNAAGKLRNKFAHRLGMKLGQEMAKNLIATLPPALKAKFKTILSWMAELPLYTLKGDVQTHVESQLHVLAFFLCLFEALSDERHRFAFEKMQRIYATAATQPAANA
jgi:hypothetical protein